MDIEFVVGVSAIFLILLWFFVGLYYQYFFPPIRKEKLGERVEFIANILGITTNREYPLPVIYFCDQRELLELIPLEERWDFLINETKIWGMYFQKWNRIFFDRSTREDMLVHEAAHFVLRTYGREFPSEEKEEEEVWKITRFFLLTFYPARYVLLMMLYGAFGIWGYDFTRHSIAESPA